MNSAGAFSGIFKLTIMYRSFAEVAIPPDPGNIFYAHFKMADTYRGRLVTKKMALRLA